jgi:hypothetical protein
MNKYGGFEVILERPDESQRIYVTKAELVELGKCITVITQDKEHTVGVTRVVK